MIDPRIRAKRLSAEYDRVRRMHERGGLFALEESLGEPPDRYVFRFSCRGIAEVIGDVPRFSELHLVAVQLTETYPTTPPRLLWLTPIFHPNVKEGGQAVCIGEWYPAKTLDHLVHMLGEMIQYVNYASHDPLNLEASLWAMAHREILPVDRRQLLDPHRTVFARQSAPADPGELDIRVL